MGAPHGEAAAHVTAGQSFYRLGFASQLIVWATRRRLHLRSGGNGESKAPHAFKLARLERAHGALMSVVDVLTGGASNRIQLHGLGCPCLAPHEVGLLNALAHLQQGRVAEGHRCLEQVLGDVAARLALPAVDVIAGELAARNLQIAPIGNGPRLLSSTPAIGASIH